MALASGHAKDIGTGLKAGNTVGAVSAPIVTRSLTRNRRRRRAAKTRNRTDHIEKRSSTQSLS